MAILELKGDIVDNDVKWVYDWLEWDATCPNDAKRVIDALEEGETLEVHVNSYGGDVKAGQELYSLFHAVDTSTAVIQSFAASAAGVAAMGCRTVQISPVGVLMIHNVSCYGVSGDYHDMDRVSNMLQSLNECMANAYVTKSGRSMEEVLEIMDRETWLGASQALEYGFVDEILQPEDVTYTNAFGGMRLTQEIYEKVKAEKAKSELLKDLDLYGV